MPNKARVLFNSLYFNSKALVRSSKNEHRSTRAVIQRWVLKKKFKYKFGDCFSYKKINFKCAMFCWWNIYMFKIWAVLNLALTNDLCTSRWNKFQDPIKIQLPRSKWLLAVCVCMRAPQKSVHNIYFKLEEFFMTNSKKKNALYFSHKLSHIKSCASVKSL